MRLLLRPLQQIVGDINGSLHMGNHIKSYG
jgi:hypothetical protein